MSLFIIPEGGLSNMLRVVFSWYQKAKTENKSLNVLWIPNSVCPGNFLDLFEPINGINFIHNLMTNGIDYKGCFALSIFNSPKMYIYLKLLPELKSSVDDNLSTLENFIAIHVRRTDHIKDAKSTGLYTSDEMFFSFLDKHSNMNIYLATDNRDTQDIFVSKYSTRIKCLKWINPTNNFRQTTLKDAVIDIFTCIKAKEFMGSGWSSFTDLINDLRIINN
jgi:hypothetical protein